MNKTLIALYTCCILILLSFRNETSQFNYALDTEKSIIEWTGASPNTAHQGSFEVTSQGIQVIDSMITAGSFTIPIASIENYDLAKVVKPVLIKHLKSEDFFNVKLYPEATFTITSVEPITSAAEGAIEGANVLVTGDFSLIGATHPLTFPAKISFEDNAFSAEAIFKLDRTQWGMNYAADPALENRHIYPEVDIHLKLSGIKM